MRTGSMCVYTNHFRVIASSVLFRKCATCSTSGVCARRCFFQPSPCGVGDSVSGGRPPLEVLCSGGSSWTSRGRGATAPCCWYCGGSVSARSGLNCRLYVRDTHLRPRARLTRCQHTRAVIQHRRCVQRGASGADYVQSNSTINRFGGSHNSAFVGFGSWGGGPVLHGKARVELLRAWL